MNGPMVVSNLELRNLGFSYSETKESILRNINMNVPPGEIFGLFGLSGSGKTTLLKVIAGLLKPTEGAVYLNQVLVKRTTRSVSRELSRTIGMSFQRGGLLDAFNVEENIDFALKELTENNFNERNEMIDKVLGQVGLLEARKKAIKELSGGMQKRLSLARAMALRPQVLLLDEPTAGLDPVTAADILKLIQAYQAENRTTILLVTSEVSVGFLLAKKLGFLWEGSVIEAQTAEDFKKSDHPAVRRFLNA